MSNKGKNRISKIPNKTTWLRAAISAIPAVGGALDHLIFDKADEIRARNIEDAISSIAERLNAIPEELIDSSWFESEEALAMFRNMADKIEFEPDSKKRESLAKVVAASGMKKFSSDKRKLSILDHLSRLSFVQMRLMSIISQLQPQKREVGNEIVQSVNALWANQIIEAIKHNSYGQFWEGQLNIGLELEVLESLNVIRTVPLITGGEKAFELTSLGMETSKYFCAGNN